METEGVIARRRGWIVKPWENPQGKGVYQEDQLCTQCCCGICCCAGEFCNPSRQQGVNYGIWALCVALLVATGLLVFVIWLWIEVDEEIARQPSPPGLPQAPPVLRR